MLCFYYIQITKILALNANIGPAQCILLVRRSRELDVYYGENLLFFNSQARVTKGMVAEV